MRRVGDRTDVATIECPPALRLILTGEDETPDWQERAACRGMDTAIFFPPVGSSAVEAKAVCATCPVRSDCLEEGKKHRHGIWGGVAQKRRRSPRQVAS